MQQAGNYSCNDVSGIRGEVSDVRSEVSKLEIRIGEGFKYILKWIIVLMVGFASLIITCKAAFLDQDLLSNILRDTFSFRELSRDLISPYI